MEITMSYIRLTISILCVTVCLGSLALAQDADKPKSEKEEKKKPKYTVEQVMEQAFKGKDTLVKKVASGKATDKEKMAVLDMFISLVENDPPKGDKASWQKLSGAAALAAAKVAVGRKDAAAEFKAATKCGACHKPHKPTSAEKKAAAAAAAAAK